MQVCFKKYRCLPENLENKETYAWGRSDISFFFFFVSKEKGTFCAHLLYMCGFALFPRRRSRSRDQKRTYLRPSENSVLIPLTTPSFTIKWKLGLQSVGRTKLIDHKAWERECDWVILPLLLPTPTISDGVNVVNGSSQKIMETFCFSLIPIRWSYDSAYDSDFSLPRRRYKGFVL